MRFATLGRTPTARRDRESPGVNRERAGRLQDQPPDIPAILRGYFPQKGAWQWLKLVVQNRGAIWSVVKDSFTRWHGAREPVKGGNVHGLQEPSFLEGAEPSTEGD